MGGCLRACIEEFEGARESVGNLRALFYVSILIVVTLVCLVVVLILGVLLLTLFPVALLIGLVAMLVSWAGKAGRGVGKPASADPWLSEQYRGIADRQFAFEAAGDDSNMTRMAVDRYFRSKG